MRLGRKTEDRTQVTFVALDYGCMSSENGNKVTDQRIALPKPDAKNITVLTSKLPNEPILPWHHYDSPWMGDVDTEAEEVAEAGDTSEAVPVASDLAEEVKQLTLALEADTGTAALPDDERLTPPNPPDATADVIVAIPSSASASAEPEVPSAEASDLELSSLKIPCSEGGEAVEPVEPVEEIEEFDEVE